MTKMNQTLEIAIPAFNEENNITRLLNSLLSQKISKFILKKIAVYTDASSDQTPDIVQKISKKNKIIKLVKGAQRKGKYYRVKQIFNNCQTNYLIILDADIALDGKFFIEKLLKTLIKDKNAVMAAANNTLLSPPTFIGKIIYAGMVLWHHICLSLPDKNISLNFFGSATAYRGSFARSTKIPEDLLDPHFYIYLTAKKNNGFKFCPDAGVFMWSISTISDYRQLLRRTIGKKDPQLEKLFGPGIYKEFTVPYIYKIKGFLKALKSQPFYTILAIFLQIYITKFTKINKQDKSPIWKINISTKKPYVYAKQ